MVRSGMTRNPANRFRRRASGGIVGAVVVGCATLGILLVCFTLYQASLSDTALNAALASVATADQADGDADPDFSAPSAPVAIGAGAAQIGSLKKPTFTLFAKHGSQPRGQIQATNATPIPNSNNGFSLSAPEINLRTQEGNRVRITANEGMIEGDRNSGGANPQRGWLRGDVVIVIDRRTDADRAALPEDQRDRPDPASIMRVEMDELRFDLEYGKVIIPGAFRLTASDVRLSAADLEVRFNEAAGRVDYLRIEHGDVLELRQSDSRWNQSVPDSGLFAGGRMTLVEMLRATLAKRIAAQEEARTKADASVEVAVRAAVPDQGDKPPPFTASTDDPPAPRTPVKYLARFEDEVDVTRRGGAANSRLQADVLEILRDFTQDDRERSRPAAAEQSGSQPAPDPATQDRIILHWTGRLVVEAVDLDDPRIRGDGRSRITREPIPAR